MGFAAFSMSATSHAANEDVDGTWTFGGAFRARYDYRSYTDPTVSRAAPFLFFSGRSSIQADLSHRVEQMSRCC